MLEDKPGILLQHYRDTFFHIREKEKQRDRLFIIVIVLLGLVTFQESYPDKAYLLPANLSLLGIKIPIHLFPTFVLLSATWTFLSVLLMRYYRTTIHIDKQYDYLHPLERKLSDILDCVEVLRESTGYITKRWSIFRRYSWRFYTIVFPTITYLPTIYPIVNLFEFSDEALLAHKIYDFVMSILIILSTTFYLCGSLRKPRIEPSKTVSTRNDCQFRST